MFREPHTLWLLVLALGWAVLLIGVLVSDLRRRRAAFASAPMLGRIAGHQPTRRPLIKWVLIVTALLLFGLALARPQGDVVEEAVLGQALDLVVALDVSQSMLAPDVEGNNRLHVARFLVAKMLEGLRQDRLGLIAFAGDTMVQCPLTLDKNAFLTFLERVDPSLLTKQGTNLAGAIETALDRFDFTASQSRVIVLISDGEDQDKARLDRAVAEAKRKQVPVFTVGIGSKEGSYLPVGRDVWGTIQYKTWRGERVVTRLDDTLLKKIARETGAKYFRASDVSTANEVAAGLGGIKRIAIAGGTRLTTRELYAMPLLAGFLLLLLEWMISERIPYAREKDHWLKRI
ncbi:MAG: VWA domain-containing protein [Candidatus Riflebacteria bacterium]|nr:VWA domain-containing protein [Candidatus Riflebacteria bacterium]